MIQMNFVHVQFEGNKTLYTYKLPVGFKLRSYVITPPNAFSDEPGRAYVVGSTLTYEGNYKLKAILPYGDEDARETNTPITE